MRKPSTYFIATLIGVSITLSGILVTAGQQANQSVEFSRRAMLENIAFQIIVPLHEDFLQQTDDLRAATYAFQAAPTVENLERLQQAWQDTSRLWHKVTLFRLGRTTFVYHSRIANDAPPAIQLIDQIINGPDPLDAETLAVFGSNVVGLRTLEYLIFDPVGGNDAVLANYTTQSSASQRMLYLVLTVEDLYATVTEVMNVWSPDGLNYLADFVDEDDPNSVQGSISMLANQMISSLESMVNMTIGWPLGTVAGEIQPDIVEAKYSGYSLQEIRSYFEILRDTFNGSGATGNALGFDDYLDYLGAHYNDILLADAIDQQFDVVLAAIDAVEEPFDSALIHHPEQIERIYEEGRLLIALMKTDMASRLGITITFSDSDGD